MRATKALRAVGAALLAVTISLVIAQAEPAGAVETAPVAGGWSTRMFPVGQPLCDAQAAAPAVATYFDRRDCGFGRVTVSNVAAGAAVSVQFVAPDGAVLDTKPASAPTSSGDRTFDIVPGASWPAGPITLRATVGSTPAEGSGLFYVNQLGADLTAAPKAGGYRPGDAIPVTGTLFERDSDSLGGSEVRTAVAGTYSLQVVTPAGVRGPYGPYVANDGGTGRIARTLPAEATAGLALEPGESSALRIQLASASYTDASTGAWAAKDTDAGLVQVSVPGSVTVENSFVSAVGWVKPGESYPFRVFVRNPSASAISGARVTIPVVDGTTFTKAEPLAGHGTATISGGAITWDVGTVPAGTASAPSVKTLVVEARADTTAQDAQIVWKDLSSVATLTYDGGAAQTSRSHGPKVIPPKETYDTARYGDRPFAVVPVDYFDRKHKAHHTGERLWDVINSPDVPGSTFNLFQEMSFGQLFPQGAVPSSDIASAGWDYEHGWHFSDHLPQGTCKGVSHKQLAGSALYPNRVQDGWYQLPGDTEYYGGDRYGSALGAAYAGIGALMDIDSACGPTGKAVYDAAHIADPEIDYSDYDTDKDGVVDFFMMVFVGDGGNGASQTNLADPHDNIWPHSSSLEFYYEDEETGLKGYVSDDQLKNLRGEPLWYTDDSRSTMTTEDRGDELKVYVRVGPYNVNPESAIDKASVISHEYGHSLGLPDYYTLGSDRETYGGWNLMASDHSQHMDVNAKQELGWIVPRVLDESTTVSGWKESKADTHRIDWVDAAGQPYTLQGENVHNGEAYVAKLPARQIIAAVPSGDHAWWSRSGNDFGCSPEGGHNLDIALPETAALPDGTKVTVSFKNRWDIEWDYDYGFVMITQDNGETYTSLPSTKGYTTSQAVNPTANACQAKYGNGLTGSSKSYQDGTFMADRVAGVYPESPPFLDDAYEFTSKAGHETVLRLSYATDPGLARPGWFVDDIVVKAGETVLYQSDFEEDEEMGRLFNGGCDDNLVMTAKRCTAGWQHVSASSGSPADHAYYLELRDRSGFDLDGNDQADRGAVTWTPGLLLVYTDENHGYGNSGTPDPPAQSPLDASPQPGENIPVLDDAAWNADDSPFSDVDWVDNYEDPSSEDGNWHFRFGCLGFDVLSMTGDSVGPETAPGDLAADVAFTIGDGCGTFDYGHLSSAPHNARPTAVIQVKQQGSHHVFDASASTDDDPSTLTYAWDVESDGTVDSTASNFKHKYPGPGTYTATLTVTDAGGLSDTATATVVVAAPGGGGGGGGGSTGGDSGSTPSGTTTTTTTTDEQPSSSPPSSGEPVQQTAPPSSANLPPVPQVAPQAPTGGVAAQTKTVRRSASGWGAIRARVGKAHFWLRAGQKTARLHWDDRAARVHLRVAKAKVAYKGKQLRLTGVGVSGKKRLRFTLTIVDRGRRDTLRIALSNGYRRSGAVVKGGLAVR